MAVLRETNSMKFCLLFCKISIKTIHSYGEAIRSCI